MVKIKPILPSLREKPRYIVCKTNMNKQEIHSGIRSFIGELGMARAGVQVLDNKIVRTNSRYLDEVKSALILIRGMDIIKVSGLLNKAKKIGG